MSAATNAPRLIHLLDDSGDFRRTLEADVRAGLGSTPKWLPPKYFYDDRGSELFERITRLPEYYVTRAETALLEDHAHELVNGLGVQELVELGSGSSRKTRLLLEAVREYGGTRYVAFDVSEDALLGAASALQEDYDWLEFTGVIGDFERHLPQIPREGPGLVAFIGSTIGNQHPDERVPFLRQVRSAMRPDDHFLLGVDLVKDVAVLEAAYDDAAGVTAEFNRNVLHVLNRELDGDFPVDAFRHRAFFDRENSWIEMRLVAERDVDVRLAAIDLEVSFAAGEELRTELSCKFTRASVERALNAAGFRMERWIQGPDAAFGLALAAPADRELD